MSDDVTFSDGLLVGLTPEQREAVTSSQRRLLVRATAGSGKTHVLTLRMQRRVASGLVEPDQVLAMTFTRKAAEELRTRLWRSGIRGVQAGTFHRAAMDIVANFRLDQNLRPLSIESSRKKLVSDLATQLNASGDVALQDWQLPRIEQEIGWALSQGFTGTTYARRQARSKRNAPVPADQMAEIIDRYVALCRSRGVVDFDLLLSEAITILRDERAALAAFRHQHRDLYVDETQDMNPLQFTLLKQMAGDDPQLFCVGDPNQSIYGFNGSSPKILQEIVHTWPDTVMLDLTRNHRSTAHIVAVADTLLEAGATGITPAKEQGELPLMRSYDDEATEAEQVAAWISTRHGVGSPWRSMAVLARTNAQLTAIAAALSTMGIPFERRGIDHSPASDLLGGDGPATHWYDTQSADAVALSTIHRSKGLEWRHVAVIGWAEGVLPHFNATTPEQLAEEQRLAYVALTRAEDSLLLTWHRGLGEGKSFVREPSRFLTPIETKLRALRAEESPLVGDERKRRLAELRKQLGESEG